MPRVVIVHGQKYCQWYPWLAEELKALECQVVLKHENDYVECDQDTIVVGYCSGAIAALRVAETTALKEASHKSSWDLNQIKLNCPWIVQFGSPDDPFVPEADQLRIALALCSDFYFLPGRGNYESHAALDLHCLLDCHLQFDCAADFANHREKFCINSEYSDPAKFQALLDAEFTTSSKAQGITFGQIEQYLTSGFAPSNISQLSLLDLKTNLAQNDVEMKKLRKQLVKDREKEKAQELRALKLKQTQALLAQKQDDEQVQELFVAIERQKQQELEARLVQEQIKNELHHLDHEGIASLEEERKRELLELTKAKEALLEREQAAIREIEQLEQRVKAQELEFREKERLESSKLTDVSEQVQATRAQALRAEHMERSRVFGAQTAQFKQERQQLLDQQAKLKQVLDTNDNQEEHEKVDYERRVHELEMELKKVAKQREMTLAEMDEKLVPLLNEPHSSVDEQTEPAITFPSPPKAKVIPQPVVKKTTIKESDSLEQLQQNLKPAEPKPSTPTSPDISQVPPPKQPNLQPAMLPNNYPVLPPTMAPGIYTAAQQAIPPSFHPFPQENSPFPGAYFYPPPNGVYGGIPPQQYSPWGMPPQVYMPPTYPYYSPPQYHSGLAATGAAIMGFPPFQPFPFEPPKDPETIRLQQQLDQLKQLKEQRDFEMENIKFNQLIQCLQGKTPDISNFLGVPEMPPKQTEEDNELKLLRLRHTQEMLQIQHERDMLEEQEKLLVAKEMAEKRRKESQQQKEHDEWLAQQKKMVMTMRMNKVLAKETPGVQAPIEYDSQLGFTVFWDYVLSVPLKAQFLQLTYALYGATTVRSKYKVIRAHECESQRCVLSTRRDFEQIDPSASLRLVIEIAMVSSPNDKTKPPVSLGWTAVNVFLPSLKLQEGKFKLPISISPLPQPSSQWDLPTAPLNDDKLKLYIRTTHAAQAEDSSKFPVNPDATANEYLIPPEQIEQFQAKLNTSRTPVKPPTPQVTPAATIAPAVVKSTPPISIPKVDLKPYIIIISQIKSTKEDAWKEVSSLLISFTKDGKDALWKSDILQLENSSTLSVPIKALVELPPSVDILLTIGISGNQPITLSTTLNISLFEDKTLKCSSSDPKLEGLITLSILPEAAPVSTPISSQRNVEEFPPVEAMFLALDNSASRKNRLFNQGNGVNVYVDGARGLPNTVTITKVTVFAFAIDMTSISPQRDSFCLTSLDDIAMEPSFNLLLEYREERFNSTMTLLFRVDTIEKSSKTPLVLGYAAFPMFLDNESKSQPSKPTVQEFSLNEGAFQIPLRLGVQVGSPTIDMTAKACDSFLKLSCSTLLIRINIAAKTQDGLQVLSRNNVSQVDWESQNVVIPPPKYSNGVYDSVLAQPTAMEEKLYAIVERRKKSTVKDALVGLVENNILENISSLLEKKPKLSVLENLGIFKFESEIGFRIAIDGLYNLPTGSGVFYKVLVSIFPPASFYQSPTLSDDVQMTINYNWTSAQSNPEFIDGYITFRDIAMLFKSDLTVLFDVRSIKQVKGEYVSQPFAWAYIKPIDAKSNCISPGCFQLPLFSGAITMEILQNEMDLSALIEQETQKKKGLISYLSNASIIIRIEDNQLPNVVPTSFSSIQLKGLPTQLFSKYTYDPSTALALKKKKPLNKLIPSKRTERDFEKELNVAFAKDMNITHYSF
ncbi:hypothetical protein THRCLA_03490 [Thraustotheca clavata]|uniref:Uncharacterized protein n=1 Tax=Thraustotheca clavata TaxID=74557 RepID=A0A1W0A1V7_9STRA|nr:hypothetical protein THRCLA_03490 [Thraustotheca clavata]